VPEASDVAEVGRSLTYDLVSDFGIAHGDVSGLGTLHSDNQSALLPSRRCLHSQEADSNRLEPNDVFSVRGSPSPRCVAGRRPSSDWLVPDGRSARVNSSKREGANSSS